MNFFEIRNCKLWHYYSYLLKIIRWFVEMYGKTWIISRKYLFKPKTTILKWCHIKYFLMFLMNNKVTLIKQEWISLLDHFDRFFIQTLNIGFNSKSIKMIIIINRFLIYLKWIIFFRYNYYSTCTYDLFVDFKCNYSN